MTTKRAKIPKLADKANSVNATYLSSTVNIDYIDQRTTGLNIFRLTSVTYSGTFPPGVGAGSMNGSILTEYVWDGNAGEQQLFHFGLNKWYWRIRGGGTFGVWREILDNSKLGAANGIAGLNNNAEIEASLLQNVIYPKLNVAYASNGDNSLLESLIASGVYSNIFKHVSLGAVTYSAEFSSDGTTWIDVSNDVNLKKVMFGTEDAYFQMGKGSSLSLLFTCVGQVYDIMEFLRFTGGFSADTSIEINGVLNSSTTDEFTDILSCNSLTSSTGPGAIILRHKRIALHPTNTVMYKKLRVVIKQGTTVNGSLQELGWYGYYQQGLRKLPTHDFVTNYLRDTYFPRNVYTANGNFIGNLQGKSTSSGVTDSGSAGNTDLHSVYEGCPVGFSNVRLTGTVIKNLPIGFTNGSGCTLQCMKWDASTGHMLFIPISSKSLYAKYKSFAGGYGEWQEIGGGSGSTYSEYLINIQDLIGSDGLAKTAELRDKIANYHASTNFIAYLPSGSYTGVNGGGVYVGANIYIPVQIIRLNSGEYQILLKGIATGNQTEVGSKRANIILDKIRHGSSAGLYIYEDTDFIELDYNALRNYGSYGTWLQRQLDEKPNYPIMCKVAKNTQIAANPNIFVDYDSVSQAQYFAGQICIPVLYYGSGNPLYRCEMYISNFSTGTTSDISVIVHDKGQGI